MGKHFEKQTKLILGKHKRTIQKKKKANAVLRNGASKNEWTNIKKKANAFWRKMNGQTF